MATPGAAADEPTWALVLAVSSIHWVRELQARGDSPQAVLAARCAVALARQAGDPGVLSDALIALSVAEWGRGDGLEQAVEHALEALVLAPESDNVPRHCDALLIHANLHAMCGNTGYAGVAFERVLQLWRDHFGPAPHRVPAKALVNLGTVLALSDMHRESVDAYAEACAIWLQLPGEEGSWRLATSNLALALIQLGRIEAGAGLVEAAQSCYQRALQALPPLDPSNWRSMGRIETQGLKPRVHVLTDLGRIQEARSSLAVLLRLARRRRVVGLLIQAHVSGLHLHLHTGQHAKAERSALRVLALRDGADVHIVRGALAHLATLYAHRGAYGQALACRREAAQMDRQTDAAANALRCRVAALERRSDRRRAAGHEEQLHARRLSVIGRLIGQTHHALHDPVLAVGRLCTRALHSLRVQDPPATQGLLLREMINRIDRTALVTQQLKLYSYRSTPLQMPLSLRQAVLQARSGLALHLPGGSERVTLLHEAGKPDEVWADPQRLGILLKVLLIEMLTLPHDGGPPVQVLARIDVLPGDAMALELDVADATLTDAMPSMGVTLCMEIAHEMNGALVDLQGDAGLVRYRLALGTGPTRVPGLREALAA